MHTKQLLALFGLKYNPFLPNIPVESLWTPPEMDTFLFRVENLVMDGGFALLCGDPGLVSIPEQSGHQFHFIPDTDSI